MTGAGHGAGAQDGIPQADHIRFLFDPRATLSTLAGHRRRFAATVASLSPEELTVPSRCAGWTVADVLRHCAWADATMRRVWAGDRGPVEGFDPRTTPDEAVRADRAVPDEEARRRYLSSTEEMVAEWESPDPERIGRPTLSPAGRVPWWLSAMHLGWDSTIHERDVMTPLGRAVEPAPDEVVAALGYSLALASFFAGSDPLDAQVASVRVRGEGGRVTVWAVDDGVPGAHDPSGGAPAVFTGVPVEVVDAVSGRGPLTGALHGDAAGIDRLGGLARYFTSAG